MYSIVSSSGMYYGMSWVCASCMFQLYRIIVCTSYYVLVLCTCCSTSCMY